LSSEKKSSPIIMRLRRSRKMTVGSKFTRIGNASDLHFVKSDWD
jgi:hypothetical protein